jgi:wyosine [tRNA(Phe)-imidazoG37] synthetase (radical SAM superfamily)
MRHVFGPVPSRRLGRSLGIDPVSPKTCNWNCVYCQLGRSTPLSSEPRRMAPVRTVLDELEVALASSGGHADWLTFVGSGEPALHSELGPMITGARALTRLPIAVITNGSLLDRLEVRRALGAADAVLPSLDAGSERLFRAVNRPFPTLTLEGQVSGLAAFRKTFSGALWVEVMLVAGLNDGEQALRDLAAALGRIQPDEVHISVPTRPPAEPWVRPPGPEALEEARSILGGQARVVLAVDGPFELGAGASLDDAIVEVIARHPMSEEELVATLRREQHGKDVERALRELSRSPRVQVVERGGRRYWTAARYRYGHGPASGPRA